MNRKNIYKTVSIFVALSIVGVGMIVLGQASIVETFHNVFPPLGAAIFASGLTFFMVEMTRQGSR